MAKDKDVLEEAKEEFKRVQEAESEDRDAAEDDVRFARLSEQWPERIKLQREQERRPMLTLNRMPAFIRQVVNDARQNKPSIKVHPADSKADPHTAKILSGLIRNIEATSNADVAYDTATEHAVDRGKGYFGIDLDYTCDDGFDHDIKIARKGNPFAIFGDPMSKEADSSDWDVAFEVEHLAEEDYARTYPGADKVDFEGEEWTSCEADWRSEGKVMVARWWTRTKEPSTLLKLSDGTVIYEELLTEDLQAIMQTAGIEVVATRPAHTYKVKLRTLSGAEVLEEVDWPGKYIPLIPVYGDEVNVKGKRYFRSLIRDAKDAQRNLNYWRTTAAELVALAPRVPFIGPKGAFKSDARKWKTANSVNHAYLEYDGNTPPARQPLDTGAAAGALQEALNASDDIKAIVGLYDASLGAKSNETSGKAILARQKEGDVSTFHFQDNMARAIRHAGRILLDLIPKVYGPERMIRILGEDMRPEQITLGQPTPLKGPDGQVMQQPAVDPMTGQPVVDPAGNQVMQDVMHVYDLTAGKYDLTVSTGPSYTTRREEAAGQMMELTRNYPAAGPVIGDLIAKNLDWPGADEIAERLKMLLPTQAQGGLPPEVQKAIDEGKAELEKLRLENQQHKLDKSLDAEKLRIDQFRAETERAKAEAEVLSTKINAAQAAESRAFEQERLQHERYVHDTGLESQREQTLLGLRGQDEAAGSAVKPIAEHIAHIGEQVAAVADVVVQGQQVLQQVGQAVQQVAGQVQQVSAQVADVQEELASPTELVRGEDGRPAGVSRRGKVRNFRRGEDGSLEGLE